MLWLWVVGAASAGGQACPAPSRDLPTSVPIRSMQEGYNSRWDVVLRDNTLCVRRRDAPGEWLALGAAGRPQALLGTAQMVAMSVDGTHLQVELSDGRLLRATDLRRRDVPTRVQWTERWGWPAGRGPGLSSPPGARRFVVSDSHPFQVRHYTDIAGRRHPVGLGVAHQYRLSDDGWRLYLNDWWLPADWSRRVCLPEGGPAVDLSASGSTLMVRLADGRLFTRLYDVDTAGENDLLTYTWSTSGRRGPSRSVRALPAEPWVEHPGPSEDVGGRISIHQTGRGNAARVLRVEADDGVFEKGLHDAEWTWVSVPGHRAVVVEAPADGTAEPVHRLTGAIRRQGVAGMLAVEASTHDPVCPPTRLQVTPDTTAPPHTLVLHLVPGFVSAPRPEDWRTQGGTEPVRGALWSHGAPSAAEDSLLHTILADSTDTWLPMVGTAGPTSITVEQMPTDHRFGVRRAEKSGQAGRLVITLSAAGAEPTDGDYNRKAR